MSSFSCRTGRYCSTAGDIIVFKVDPDDDDDATIRTESQYPESIGGKTIKSEKTQFTRPISQFGASTHIPSSQCSRPALSTFSSKPESTPSTASTSSVSLANSTIPVNEDHDDDNYNILLRRQNDKPVYPSHVHQIQTGRIRFF